MKLRLMLPLIILLAIYGRGYSQIERDSYEFGFFYGLLDVDSMSSGSLLGMKYTYDFTPRNSFEGALSVGLLEPANIYLFQVNYRHNITMISRRFIPYLSAGLGSIIVTYDELVDKDQPQDKTYLTFNVSVGTGAFYFFKETLAVRTDFQRRIAKRSKDNDLEISAGISWFFL